MPLHFSIKPWIPKASHTQGILEADSAGLIRQQLRDKIYCLSKSHLYKNRCQSQPIVAKGWVRMIWH